MEEIVAAAVDGRRLRLREIETLLAVTDTQEAGLLFEGAQTLRERHFGRSVFLYGFVYFSTYCRNRCTFCFYRRGNRLSPRYRKTAEEVVGIARGLAGSGVHLVDLTMGEDPAIHDRGTFEVVADLVAKVRASVDLPVMVSPGVVPPDALRAFRDAGADWYACYQETHSPALYEKLRPDQDFLARVAARGEALSLGYSVEDGFLLGVGETAADRARSIVAMRAQGVQQVRVMGFVPQSGTPLWGRTAPSLLEEAVAIAVMRLAMPDRLIPASLDIDGLRGLDARLRAGANVVTSIIPPGIGLAGVSQATLDIDEGFRTVQGVEEHLRPLGLEIASQADYVRWLEGGGAPSSARSSQARRGPEPWGSEPLGRERWGSER